MNIKVLSLMEPWASLIGENVKTIETRSWKTNYRGPLYIHASKKQVNLNDTHILNLVSLLKEKQFQYGMIIAKCNLIDCICMDEPFIEEIKKNKKEYMCGIYEPMRYAWILDNIELLSTPIPAKGSLNIWNYIT